MLTSHVGLYFNPILELSTFCLFTAIYEQVIATTRQQSFSQAVLTALLASDHDFFCSECPPFTCSQLMCQSAGQSHDAIDSTRRYTVDTTDRQTDWRFAFIFIRAIC